MISQSTIVHFPFFHEDVRKLGGLFCLDFIDDLYFFSFCPEKAETDFFLKSSTCEIPLWKAFDFREYFESVKMHRINFMKLNLTLQVALQHSLGK